MRTLPFILFLTIVVAGCNENSGFSAGNETSIEFSTSDSILDQLYHHAEAKATWNITSFGDYEVLVEGAQYKNVWLETQPMGGYMYAKRNLTVARNNIMIFLDHQRADGRLPGMIAYKNQKIEPKYGWFQGFCLPMPAFELYFLLGKDSNYLGKLYRSLELFDTYLWKTRDSDQDGCLESWCIWDTGEDESSRFNGFPNAWPFDYPPSKERIAGMSEKYLIEQCEEEYFDSQTPLPVPIESMDIMSYSYTCRDILSLISVELNNGKEKEWREQANQVKSKIRDYLWDEAKKACFDKDANNTTMPILLHNNLRCMYFGSFDQAMADEFIEHHLLNPEEFWTPMPLPSVAANDPYFRDIPGNNWSGQPQGLTFQRSISALENYGHFAELTLIGKTLLEVVSDSMKFTQQFYPFQKTINNTQDGYGPTILATLEFISRFYGTHISQDKILWSSIDNQHDYDYKQRWNGLELRIQTKKDGWATCFVNGKKIAAFSAGVRLITDLQGQLIEIVGITSSKETIKAKVNGKSYDLTVNPNTRYRLNDRGEFVRYKSVPFTSKWQTVH